MGRGLQESQIHPLRSVSIATDRQLYHSGETMAINITVGLRQESLAGVVVHGINARNRERLGIIANYTLHKGLNVISLDYRTPDCTGCAGIAPGNYTIWAEVTVGNLTSSENATIEIRQ